MLKYQQERQNSAQINSGSGNGGAESSAPKLNSVINGESLEDIRKVRGHGRSLIGTLTYVYMSNDTCANTPCSALCTQIIIFLFVHIFFGILDLSYFAAQSLSVF